MHAHGARATFWPLHKHAARARVRVCHVRRRRRSPVRLARRIRYSIYCFCRHGATSLSPRRCPPSARTMAHAWGRSMQRTTHSTHAQVATHARIASSQARGVPRPWNLSNLMDTPRTQPHIPSVYRSLGPPLCYGRLKRYAAAAAWSGKTRVLLSPCSVVPGKCITTKTYT